MTWIDWAFSIPVQPCGHGIRNAHTWSFHFHNHRGSYKPFKICFLIFLPATKLNEKVIPKPQIVHVSTNLLKSVQPPNTNLTSNDGVERCMSLVSYQSEVLDLNKSCIFFRLGAVKQLLQRVPKISHKWKFKIVLAVLPTSAWNTRFSVVELHESLECLLV